MYARTSFRGAKTCKIGKKGCVFGHIDKFRERHDGQIKKNACKNVYRIVSNKRPGGVAIFQKGDVYKRQVFNAKMQCLSLFTMTCRREI